MAELANSEFIVVLVTTPTREQAIAIAQHLVQSHLAACVKLLPVHSIYSWQGELQQEEEWQLLIKSQQRQFAAIATAIQATHPYEVPEIIALPIAAGSAPYLQWISDHVDPPANP